MNDATRAAADALGITAVLDHLERLEVKVDAISQPPDVLTFTETKQLLRVGTDEVYRLLETGQLWKLDLGTNTIRIPRAAVEELLAARPKSPPRAAIPPAA